MKANEFNSKVNTNTTNMRHFISGSCDKVFYCPGERVFFSLFVKNDSDNPIRVSNFRMTFDFGSIFSNVETIIPTNDSKTISISFVIPLSIYGDKRFRLLYELYSYNLGGNSYKQFSIAEDKYFIKIIPEREINTSRYIAFVSRGLSDEDKIVGDRITYRIKQWNFDTRTVGIEVSASDRYSSRKIRDEITKADILFAIATPRNYNYLLQTWSTLEWLQSEVGIAYGINKPLVIIQEESVTLSALPKYLSDYGDIPRLKFKRTQLYHFFSVLDLYMPSLRESIKKNKVNEFFSNCFKLGVLGLASIKAAELISNAFDGFTSKN